jgi:hypothetical protein
MAKRPIDSVISVSSRAPWESPIRKFERINQLHSLSEDYELGSQFHDRGLWMELVDNQMLRAHAPQTSVAETKKIADETLRSFNGYAASLLNNSKVMGLSRQRDNLDAEYALVRGLLTGLNQRDIAYSVERAVRLNGSSETVAAQEAEDDTHLEHLSYLEGVLRKRNDGQFEPLPPMTFFSPVTMARINEQANTPLPAPQTAIKPNKPFSMFAKAPRAPRPRKS